MFYLLLAEAVGLCCSSGYNNICEGKELTKSKLTKSLADEISKFVSAGGHIKTAAEMVGMTPATVYKWFKEGKKESERIANGERPKASRILHHYLWKKIAHARSSNQMALVMTIQKEASEGNIQAAQWLLGNRHKADFGYMTRSSMDDRMLGESELSSTSGGLFSTDSKDLTFGDAIAEVYGTLHTSEPTLPGVEKEKLLTSPQQKALRSPLNALPEDTESIIDVEILTREEQ